MDCYCLGMATHIVEILSPLDEPINYSSLLWNNRRHKILTGSSLIIYTRGPSWRLSNMSTVCNELFCMLDKSMILINMWTRLYWYATKLMFSSRWFRTAHRLLRTSDLATMTNFCWTKLHMLMIVNLSFACSTETAIDYCICHWTMS